MTSGDLKRVLNESTVVRKIKVKYPKMSANVQGTVMDIDFDKQTRRLVILRATQNPPPRTDKFHLMRAFLFDLRDTHTVLCWDKESEVMYSVERDYSTDGDTLLLNLAKL